MPFRFSLEQVLRVRESIEKREELALQRAEMEVAGVQRRIEVLTEELGQAAVRREEALQKSIPAHELQDIDAEIRAGVEAKLTLLEAVRTLQQHRDAQMKIYQAAHNARRMLTDLEEQQRTEYEHQETRTQQKRIDDIFAARAQRG
jgi:flagellar export protein FliJ